MKLIQDYSLYSNKLYPKFLILLFFQFSISPLYSQFTSLDNNNGYWIDSTDWEEQTAPDITLTGTDINIYGEIISLNCLEINLGRLTVFDTLIINGNLILQNKAELFIEENAVLILFGDYTSKNKVNVNNRGTIIIVGNFEMLGSNLQGQFINNGNVYVFDQTPEMVEDTVYNDLACYDNNGLLTCGYLTEQDFKSDKYYSFYKTLPFSNRVFLDSNNPCYELDFYMDGTLVCPEEVVEFTLSSIGIESVNDILWQFGENATPSEAVGPGPHEVYYTTGGNMEIMLIDKFNPDLNISKNLEVANIPEKVTISSNSVSDEYLPPYADKVCKGSTYEYTADGELTSTYKWTVPSLNIDVLSGNNTIIKWDIEPGEHLIFVQEINYAGCASEISEGVVLVSDCKNYKEEFSDKTSYAFSPNEDNINDTWVIPGIEKYPLAKIYVFNKNGETLFISDRNYQNDWNGTVDGVKLEFDSYFYIIDLSAYQQKNVRGIVSIFW